MENNRPLVILGSARKDSDTKKLVERTFAELDHELIDLLDHTIYSYDYSTNYPKDDSFQAIAKQLLNYQSIVFATPVYWYAMSGLMKTFFDRLTDLVTFKKEIGRQLKGKKIFLLAVGTDKDLPYGFDVPFRLTSEYLDMEFVSTYYCSKNNLDFTLRDINDIIVKIKAADKGYV